jgi:uncharacterized protein YhaN
MAYGPFTDNRLDLSGGQQGLHLIYGPNEAGKSSSLRAITDFLYGIPARTEDNFVHQYAQLRIGATLRHSDGTELKVIRRKAHQKALRLDDDETPVDEMEFARFLGDVDRDFFGMMFGINHDRLRRGGQEIAAGKGKLGELLFATGAGLADLQSVQTGLQFEIDALLKPSGRSGAIHDGLLELRELRKEVALAQTSVETWKQKLEQFENADQRRTELEEELGRMQAELERLSRIEKSLTAIGLWKTHQKGAAALAKVPRLEDDFSRRSTDAIAELKQAETQMQDAEAGLAQIEQELASVSQSGDLLGLAEMIEELRDRFGHYRRSLQDRPAVIAKRDLLDQESLQMLRDLNLPADLAEIDQLRIPADRKTRIHQLGSQQERLSERMSADQKTIERLRLQIKQAQNKLAETPEHDGLGLAKSNLQTVMKQGDLLEDLLEIEQVLERLAKQLELALRRLPGWRGELAELESLALPSIATIDRFDKELGTGQQELRSIELQRMKEQETLSEIKHQLSVLESDQPIATVQELEEWRQKRNRVWKLLREMWIGEGNDPSEHFLETGDESISLEVAFADSMEQADRIADNLRTDAQRVALKSKLLAEHQRAVSKLDQLAQQVQVAQDHVARTLDEWETLWHSVGVQPLSPAEMRDWYRQCETILETVREHREAESRRRQIATKIDQARAMLVAALQLWDQHSDWSQLGMTELTCRLSDRCEQLQAGLHQRQQLQQYLNESQQALAEAELNFSRTQEEIKRLAGDWGAEMKFLRLELNALPSQADARLNMIGDLLAQKKEADRFRRNVVHIDRDAHKFVTDVASLCQAFCPDFLDATTEEQFQALHNRFDIQRDAKKQRQSLLDRQRELVEKQTTADQAIKRAKYQLNQMMLQANVMAMEHLNDAARESFERTVAEEKLTDAERQIASFANGAALPDFVAEVEAELARNETLPYRIDQLREAIQVVSTERDSVLGQIKSAEIELRQFDGNNDAAEKNALVESRVAHIEEQLHSLAVLKMSAAVLAAGIERHREKHQGPVLSIASQVFQEITLGQYAGLRTDFNEKGEPVILGVRNGANERTNGSVGTVGVEAMSDGTCDQLYLALRLASLETWLMHHEPIPLIIDDVLLNFDDDRSLATLKVLTRLSQYTQVIFFTHHQHLCELAEKSLPSDQLFTTRLEQRQGAGKSYDWLF